jgi:hypothetical protein
VNTPYNREKHSIFVSNRVKGIFSIDFMDVSSFTYCQTSSDLLEITVIDAYVSSVTDQEAGG